MAASGYPSNAGSTDTSGWQPRATPKKGMSSPTKGLLLAKLSFPRTLGLLLQLCAWLEQEHWECSLCWSSSPHQTKLRGGHQDASAHTTSGQCFLGHHWSDSWWPIRTLPECQYKSKFLAIFYPSFSMFGEESGENGSLKQHFPPRNCTFYIGQLLIFILLGKVKEWTQKARLSGH